MVLGKARWRYFAHTAGAPEVELSKALEKHVTPAALERHAGERYYARGAAYFNDGAVTDLVQTRDTLKARVLGNEEYRVSLRAAGSGLEWSCTCPLGDEGEFCKHVVATGLAWLERRREGNGSGDELETLRAHLRAQDKDTLVDLLLAQAADDPELRACLEAEALRRSGRVDLSTAKETIRRAFDVRGLVDRRGMPALVARAGSVAELLRRVLESGHAQQAVELSSYALERGIAAYERSDDSSGSFSAVLRDIAALHLNACEAGKPLDETLGAVLFKLQMRDDWGFFSFSDYAPLMSDKALACYRALAEKTWKGAPLRKSGDPRNLPDSHFRIGQVMEGLARHDGDIDALVAVKSRDLSHPHGYLRIAQILTEARRHDEALAWAERGHKTFDGNLDSRLVDFLVEALRKAGREADAVARAWDLFSQQPGLEAYKLLKQACGGKGWAGWRTRALDHLRDLVNQRAGKSPVWATGGNTQLIEILLHEGDSDAALAEARSGGCMDHLWITIAEAREEKHPQDAVEIYQQSIDSIIMLANSRAYDEAADRVRRIRELMKRQKKTKEFGVWLDALRERHRAKRSLMKRLEGVG